MLLTPLLSVALLTAPAVDPPAPVAAPDGLKRAQVSADADWVVHVDIRGLLASGFGVLLDEAMSSDDDFAEVQRELGLDPRRDIASVTVYGTADDPERPVILVAGDAALDRALDHVAGKAFRRTIDLDGVSVDRWSEDEHEDEAVYTYLARRAGSEQRLLVASPHAAGVAQGLAVLRGESASLADDDGDFGASASPSAGAFAFVAVREGFSRLEDIDPSSRVAQLVQSAVVEAGEFQDEAFVRVSVTAPNATDANQIATILQGGSALLTLVAQSEEEARPLLPLVQGLSITADGPSVTVKAHHPTARLIEMARDAAGGRRHRAHDGDAGEADEYRRAPAKPKKKSGDGWY